MTFVVLTGGIDLSIASASAAAGMILGITIEHGATWWLACLASLGFGSLLGMVNGLGIGVLKIPFFVFTLGTLSIYQSIALLTTSGATISLFAYPRFNEIQVIVNGTTGPFPTILLIGVVVYLLASFVLHFTSFGRSIYAVGSNIEAARLTGVKVTLVLISVYTISGLSAGLGAVVEDRAPDRRRASGRPEPPTNGHRSGADRGNRLYRRRRRFVGDRDRGSLPRRDPEWDRVEQRLNVLARGRERADPHLCGRSGRAPQQPRASMAC